MNRTGEYLNFVKKYGGNIVENDSKDSEKMFYDDIYNKIKMFNIEVSSYTDILKKEQEFNELSNKTINLFKMIDLEINNDVKNHFEGIKNIILMELNEKNEKIQTKKRRFINKNIHLEPEKPFVYLNANQNKKLDKENQIIIKETQSLDFHMQQTQKSLQEIKQIQNQINLHLNVQNESIEQIYRRSKSTQTNIKDGNKYLKMGKEKKRLMRRAIFVWLLCLSFIILFLHFNS